MRDYWRGEPATLGDFAARLTGSSDLYQDDARRPSASINFITAHDGFPLRDLVTYDEKHNEANGEDNRDGESHNRSWNHGVEGETDDPEVERAARPAAAQHAGDAADLPGRPDDPARRRARPHPGRQQQRLLPGQRDLLDRLGGRRRGPDRLHERPQRPAGRPSGAAPAALPARRRALRGRGARRRLAAARRAGHAAPGLGGRLRAFAGRLPQRARDHRARPARGADRGRVAAAGLQRPSRAGGVHAARGLARAVLARGRRHGDRAGRAGRGRAGAGPGGRCHGRRPRGDGAGRP